MNRVIAMGASGLMLLASCTMSQTGDSTQKSSGQQGLTSVGQAGNANVSSGTTSTGNGATAASASSSSSSSPQLAQNYGKLALSFEKNLGQTGIQAQFIAKSSSYSVFLAPDKMVFDIAIDVPTHSSMLQITPDQPNQGLPSTFAALQVNLVGANPSAQGSTQNTQPGVSNYLIGSDASKWITNLQQSGQVTFKSVYPGIDVVYYGSPQIIEHNFVVAAGADPKIIRLSFVGNQSLSIDTSGNLVITLNKQAEVLFAKPNAYQTSASGTKTTVDAQYMLLSPTDVGFTLGAHDKSASVVIDPLVIPIKNFKGPVPTLTYSTFLGGSSNDVGFGVAIDSSGNAYVVGYTKSSDFPTTTGVYQTTLSGTTFDAFVTKLNSNGTAKTYSTYLGGSSGNTLANSIAVDSSGNAYITGYTTSSNFPTAGTPFQSTFGGGSYDAFVSKLSSDGTALTYSSFLGGSGFDRGAGIALDTVATGCTTAGSACAVVVGTTASSNFSTTSGVVQTSFGGGAADAFLAKISADGTALLTSTYLGGSNRELGIGVTLDTSGNIYVVGETKSTDFPTTSPYQSSNAGGKDAFVVELNSDATSVTFSTYLGGSGDDTPAGIVLNNNPDIFIVGTTTSSDFPVAHALYGQGALNSNPHLFVTRIASGGASLVSSTYFGGSGTDEAQGFQGIAITDSANDVYVAGDTTSTDLPMNSLNTLFSTYPSGATSSGFIAHLSLNNVGSESLIADTYLGGSSDQDICVGIIGPGTNPNLVYAVGQGQSNFPTTAGAAQTTSGGGDDAFLSKITNL